MLKHQTIIYNHMLKHGHSEEFATQFIDNVSHEDLIEMAEIIDDGSEINPEVYDYVKETLRVRKSYEDTVNDEIRKHGFVVSSIFNNEDINDAFSYTIGFSVQGKSELYLKGSESKLLCKIANVYRDESLPINETLELDTVTVEVDGVMQPLKYQLRKLTCSPSDLPEGEYLQVYFANQQNELPEREMLLDQSFTLH